MGTLSSGEGCYYYGGLVELMVPWSRRSRAWDGVMVTWRRYRLLVVVGATGRCVWAWGVVGKDYSGHAWVVSVFEVKLSLGWCRIGVIGLRILIGKEFCSGWGCD
jgi:hypothetical protein